MASEELAAEEDALARLSERAESAQQLWFRLSALAERVGATVRIADERAQRLDLEPPATGGPTRRTGGGSQQVAVQEQQLSAELAAARSRLDAARAELAERERSLADAERPTWQRSARRPTGARAGPAGRPGRDHACAGGIDR
ncbi:putative chromosome partition protein Smc [Mycobacterium xenopi 3993]|nr:putative chromosome partition protein Smc [Mycobacterium xenopi 3993]